uniref:Cytoplasmic tRNA 2-thiolation protein 1 n=1 Tax=Blastobotrys adeninivorans TaxID=409370 RepID=A0A060TCQ2_BLAAD
MSVPLKRVCEICHSEKPSLKRPKTGQKICKQCFFNVFETEIHNTIVDTNLFYRGEKVAIGASGGKDSTVLAYVLKTLNERYDYGVHFMLLSVDEGIHGYRDDSLETVKRNKQQYEMDLEIVSYGDLYGWTMDQVVAQIGKKNNCTYCGVFRRQALDRGAVKLGIGHVVTGHNADDMAETVLMNLLRGDTARLGQCTDIMTASADSPVKRSKPLKYTYEKEIVLYAHYKGLDYFSTECTYSPEAFRGTARALIKNLEAVRPSSIIDIIHSGESFQLKPRKQRAGSADQDSSRTPTCERCGYLSKNRLCKACVLLDGLNAGRPKVEIGSNASAGAALATKQLEKLSF